MSASRVLICLFVPFIFLCAAGIYEVPVADIDYVIEVVRGFDRIRMSGSYVPGEPGHPELPAKVFSYLLPYGERLEGVMIVEEEWQELPGNFYIYPRQYDHAMVEEVEFTEPDPWVYSASGMYPECCLVGANSGNMRGYQICQVAVVPFRYAPQLGRLEVLTRLVLCLETEVCGAGLYPRRQTGLVKAMVERFLSDMVVNRLSIDDGVVRPPFYCEENVGDALPTELPSLLGAPIDLVIITTAAQVAQYEEYARFKKLSGYNTAVRTLSWVREHYDGVDDAERVRNFLRDAVEHWGVLYILLGGDFPLVPTRWVWMPPQEWEMYRFPTVTDMYFSDLFSNFDETWNFDGDERFCELEDSLDFYPDAYVGRLPTTEGSQVSEYQDKIDAYLHPSETDIQARALFVSSYLSRDNPPDTLDSDSMAHRLTEHLPSWFDTAFLHEKTEEEFEDSVNAGFGIVTAIGHGGVHSFQLSRKLGQHADYFFIDSLSNTNRYAVIWVLSCLNQPFQSNCVTKPWILNPQGGGVGSVALSHYSDAYIHEQFTAEHFDRVFTYPLAQSLARSKIPFVNSAKLSENWHRSYQFTINLLGDPALDLWDTIPLLYDSVVVSPDTIKVGIDTVTISVYPSGLFDVVFHKEGEIFLRDSSGTGVLEREVKTESSGYLRYSIKGDGYIGYVESLVVEPGGAYCVYKSHTVLDTADNDDGVVNPGEDIWLQVMVKNTGGSDAVDVDGRVLCGDSFVTMVRDTASYSDIAPGDSGESLTSFYFEISDSLVDGHCLDFELVLDYGGATSRDSFQLVGAAPVLEHYGQEYSVVAETVTIVPYIVNHGHGSAAGVYGRLSAYSDTVVVVDSMVVFPMIETDETVSSAPDSFLLYLTHPGAAVSFNLRVYYRDIEVINQEVILDTPVVIDSIWVYGRQNSVVVEWSKVVGSVGYRVYRASALGGQYSFLHNHLEPTCRFEDLYVWPDQDYYYYVEAVDSFMNESGSSDTVLGRTNPPLATGWPQDVFDYVFSSTNVGDIDTAVAGLEIVVCGRKGNVYAWHCDGSPVKTGDSRLYTVDPPLTSYYHELWSSPALGDVDGDGDLEIVFGCRRDYDNLYIIDNQGNELPGWPKSIAGGFISSQVLADLDEDGDLEIFAVSEDSAVVYVFHHDGTGFFSGDSVLRDLPANSYRTVALGDINCDGDLEIVFCGGPESESLYVCDKNGNDVYPFPLFIESGEDFTYAPVLGDVLGDERLEICFYACSPDDSLHKVYLVSADGPILWSTILPHTTHGSVAGIEAHPVLADITGDGRLEIMCAYLTGFAALDSMGNVLSGFPDTLHIARSTIVADIDNTDDIEIVAGSSNWNLYAYKNNGSWAPGFPIQFGNTLQSTPAAYDIDADGMLELMVAGDDYKFYVYDLESEQADWPRFRYDAHNTGTYKGFMPIAPRITHVEKSSDDVIITWNKVVVDMAGKPKDADYYVIYRDTTPSFVPGSSDSIAGVGHPDTTYLDMGVLTGSESYYYLVEAVDWAENRSQRSNMGFVFHKFINENAGVTSDRNWVSLPYMSHYDSIRDLTDDLSPAGDPISKVTMLEPEMQDYYSWIYHPVLGWYGNHPLHENFPLVLGQAYEMIAVGDDTVIYVGCNDPVGLIVLNENGGATSDRNWVALPYNAVYDSVRHITDELSPAGDPVSKVTRLDEALQAYYSWIYHPVLGWYGNDPVHVNFPIEPGTGYEFIATRDTVWDPREHSKLVVFVSSLCRRSRRVDVEWSAGSMREPVRAPVWQVRGDVYTPIMAEVDEIVSHGVERFVTERAVERFDADVVVNRSAVRQAMGRKVDELSGVGVSHIVSVDLALEGYAGLVFTVYRPDVPSDVMTEQSVGCVVARQGDVYRLVSFDVGNFQYPWHDGEEVILIIEAVRDGRGYCAVKGFVLDGGVDIQELDVVELEVIPEPRVERGVVRWCGVQSEYVVGYSIYRDGERLNGSVVRDGYRVEGEVMVRPVIRGGYETVYASSEGCQGKVDFFLPLAYAFQLYPNPFVQRVRVNYALPRSARVELRVYDVSGRLVRTLVSDECKPGYYTVDWSGDDELGRMVAAGLYFIRMTTEDYQSQQKVIFIH